MSEYIEIETEMSDDESTMVFHTNLQLAEEGAEEYESAEAMEVGSPVAQMLSPIEGIVYLRLEDRKMTITRDPEASWHIIVADVSAALKDFFL